MSNPYDPYKDQGNDGQGDQPPPYGQQPPPPPYGEQPPPPPYGEQPPSPYGAPIPSGAGGGYPGTPYGQGPYGGEAPKKTDAVSITAFVLSLSCCLSIVGAIMGIIGLGRTKNSQRKGRWAAIAAIPIGVVGTIIAGVVTFAIIYAVQHNVTPDNAEVGQCIDVTSQDNNQFSLSKKDCDTKHDAQIIVVAAVSESPVDFTTSSTQDICGPLVDPDDSAALDASGESLQVSVLAEDPDNPSPSDNFICYVEPAIGSLDKSLLN